MNDPLTEIGTPVVAVLCGVWAVALFLGFRKLRMAEKPDARSRRRIEWAVVGGFVSLLVITANHIARTP